MQVWPALRNLPAAMRATLRAVTQPGATIAGDLPPSSSVTGVKLGAAAASTFEATAVEPVNSRWSNGSATNAAATSVPPCTTATRSDGNTSASTSASSADVRGVYSEGFSITWLPAASASTSGTSARLTG